jgi:hypothetical protein
VSAELSEVTALLTRLKQTESAIEGRVGDALARIAKAEAAYKKAVAAEEQRLREQHAAALDDLREQREDLDRRRAALDALLADRVKGFEFIAAAWGDYEDALALAESDALLSKSRPAPGAAEKVRAKGRQLAEARRRATLAEWLVAFYEWHVPWLPELRDHDQEAAYTAEETQTEETDRDDSVRGWLSQEEFAALSPAQRNQRALDRYLKARKSPWQLGRDYERYIGFLREQAGFQVTYHGIFKGLDDLGRDLLAERDGVIEVIQCKRWAQGKTIHEKHVFQLLGTVLAARLEHPDKTVRGTFTTTTSLSERAREFARMLDIRVEEQQPLADYPRIKCNISRSGERIYHLPFDQQYDTTVIEPDRGERYATTVVEAEDLGFRRAWRWRAATPG